MVYGGIAVGIENNRDSRKPRESLLLFGSGPGFEPGTFGCETIGQRERGNRHRDNFLTPFSLPPPLGRLFSQDTDPLTEGAILSDIHIALALALIHPGPAIFIMDGLDRALIDAHRAGTAHAVRMGLRNRFFGSASFQFHIGDQGHPSDPGAEFRRNQQGALP